jgi:peptidoglycan/LPS O-acetylase OafA/YrhL
VFAYGTLVDYLGSGPYWQLFAVKEHKKCRTLWWRNLLYIDDFWTSTDNCASHGWYLSNDMQFFILLIILVPLFKSSSSKFKIAGHLGFSLLMIASLISCAILTAHYNLKAFWIGDVVDLLQGKTFDQDNVWNIIKYIYFKPWARIQPYIIGVYAGYIQYYYGKKKLRSFFTFQRSILLTLLGLILTTVSVFGVRGAQTGEIYSTTENVFYITFSRTSFSLGISILLLLCFNGRGGYIHRFLSHAIWTPFARVGLFAYLFHAVILDYFFYAMRDPLYYSDGRYAFYFISCAAMTYAFAFVATIFIESPLRNLEKFYKRKS